MKNLKYLLPIIFFIMIIGGIKTTTDIKSCGPAIIYKYGATVTTVQDGDWYNPATWSTGAVPAQNDIITLSNNITASKNVVVTGKLIARQGSLTFTGINEANFKGEGMDVLSSDVGLWVMEGGQLDLQGEFKTRGTNLAAAVKAGDLSFTAKEAINWKIGDDIVIARTVKGSVTDDVRKVTSVQGNLITVDKPLSDHPVVNNMWTAEVLNLSSNLTIQGTSTGYSHIFIRSTQPQNIQNVRLRYLGPRKNLSGGPEKEFVRGRYGIHFHHCMKGSVGTLVKNNAFWQMNSHSIVPHVSDGITATGNVIYDAMETPLWVDFGDETNGVTYSSNIMGKISYTVKAVTAEDATTTEFGAGAVVLGMGDGNACTDNVAFGVSGSIGIDGTGDWQWRSNNERGRWFFKGNLSHHGNGTSVWQNTAQNHTIDDQDAYYCRLGVFHGAYANDYDYNRGAFYDNALFVKAGSLTSKRLRFIGQTIINGGTGITDETKSISAGIIQVGSPVGTIDDGQPPVLYRGIKFINCVNDIVLAGGELHHDADVVDCNVKNVVVKGKEVMRIQQGGKAYRVASDNKWVEIPLFAPTSWGSGDGVKVEYFSDTEFKNKVAEGIEPQIHLSEWQNLKRVHHLITSTKYSVRFSGQIEPQYTDNFTFSSPTDAGGSAELYIEGKLIKSPILLIQAKRYNFYLNFKSTGTNISGVEFVWNCPQMKAWSARGEVVPQSQLYSLVTNVPPPPPPPVNQPPTATASSSKTLFATITLSGNGSDPEGSAVTYQWTQVSGPVVTILNATSKIASVQNALAGNYLFRLTVKDDKGLSSTVDVPESF